LLPHFSRRETFLSAHARSLTSRLTIPKHNSPRGASPGRFCLSPPSFFPPSLLRVFYPALIRVVTHSARDLFDFLGVFWLTQPPPFPFLLLTPCPVFLLTPPPKECFSTFGLDPPPPPARTLNLVCTATLPPTYPLCRNQDVFSSLPSVLQAVVSLLQLTQNSLFPSSGRLKFSVASLFPDVG